MKRMMAVVVLPLVFAACSQSVQSIVDEHRSQQMHDVYGNQPITHGAADGIGTNAAEAHEVALTENAIRSPEH